jgi:hypothetical protein
MDKKKTKGPAQLPAAPAERITNTERGELASEISRQLEAIFEQLIEMTGGTEHAGETEEQPILIALSLRGASLASALMGTFGHAPGDAVGEDLHQIRNVVYPRPRV